MKPKFFGPYTSPNDLPPQFDFLRDAVDSKAPRTKPFVIKQDVGGELSIIADRREKTVERRSRWHRRQSDLDREIAVKEEEHKMAAAWADRQRKVEVASHTFWYVAGLVSGLVMYWLAGAI